MADETNPMEAQTEERPTTGIPAVDRRFDHMMVSERGAAWLALQLELRFGLGRKILVMLDHRLQEDLPNADPESEGLDVNDWQAFVDGWEASTDYLTQGTSAAATNEVGRAILKHVVETQPAEAARILRCCGAREETEQVEDDAEDPEAPSRRLDPDKAEPQLRMLVNWLRHRTPREKLVGMALHVLHDSDVQQAISKIDWYHDSLADDLYFDFRDEVFRMASVSDDDGLIASMLIGMELLRS